MEQTSRGPARFWQGLRRNPVMIKELRSRMRGRRAFVVLTLYLLLMTGFISLVYFVYASAADDPFGPDPRQAGKAIFGAVLGVQVLLVVYIGPAFTAGAISGEKERQTYDLLRTTLMPARSLVAGKLFSALSYIFLLILASLPVQSVALLLGGVSLVEIVIGSALVLVASVTFAMVGLYLSSLLRSTLSASVTTFAAALIMTVGIPAVALVLLPVFGRLLFGPTTPPIAEAVALYVGLALATTNLPATLIISELILVNEGSLFYFTESVSGYTVYVFSPWYGFILLYVLLSLLLFVLTVRRVARTPNR